MAGLVEGHDTSRFEVYAFDNGYDDGSDIRVTGPSNFNQAGSLVSVSSSTNGTPRTATYRIPAPGGSWDAADNGPYSVGLQSSQVADTSGNTALSETLGTFNVNIAAGDPNDQISEAQNLGDMTQNRTWPSGTIVSTMS